MTNLVKPFLILVLLCGSTGAWAGPSKKQASKSISSIEKTVQNVTFTVKIVDGKKVWLPKLTNIALNQKVKARLVNTLDAPHGFEIPGIVPPTVVLPKNSQNPTVVEFTLTNKKSYDVNCHLHAAHVGAKINVK